MDISEAQPITTHEQGLKRMVMWLSAITRSEGIDPEDVDMTVKASKTGEDGQKIIVAEINLSLADDLKAIEGLGIPDVLADFGIADENND